MEMESGRTMTMAMKIESGGTIEMEMDSGRTMAMETQQESTMK
jgi:hypothetical protein